jgi:hypothetical protein
MNGRTTDDLETARGIVWALIIVALLGLVLACGISAVMSLA